MRAQFTRGGGQVYLGTLAYVRGLEPLANSSEARCPFDRGVRDFNSISNSTDIKIEAFSGLGVV